MSIFKRKVNKVLVIENPEQEDAFGIVGRMEVLLEYFSRKPKCRGLVPFLETYYLITKAVGERNLEYRKYYADYPSLEQLDVHFASLYFRPLKLFLENGSCHHPWKTYFEYCQKPKGVPFLQMLLGINAHINTDLALAVHELEYENSKDFAKINQILSEEVLEVMKFLALKEHDIFGFGGMVMKKFIINEFDEVIVKWRRQAWRSSVLLKNKELKKEKLKVLTEQIGHDLIDLFDEIEHARHVKKAIQKINSLSVILNDKS